MLAKKRKEVKVGTDMSENVQDELVALLQNYRDIFAWSYQDMLGLSSDIIQHILPLNPECSSVKQKLRRMKPEMSLKIKEVVKKQFDAGFLAVAQYPEWVTNIVLVPK